MLDNINKTILDILTKLLEEASYLTPEARKELEEKIKELRKQLGLIS